MGPGLEPLVGLLRYVHYLEMRIKLELTCSVQPAKELAETC